MFSLSLLARKMIVVARLLVAVLTVLAAGEAVARAQFAGGGFGGNQGGGNLGGIAIDAAGVVTPPVVLDSNRADTRAGCSTARRRPVHPPMDWQTTAAFSTPAASSTAARSSANRARSKCSGGQ